MTMTERAQDIADQLSDLLAMHGVPLGLEFPGGDVPAAVVGCRWCEYSRAFDITIPERLRAVANKAAETLERAGYDVDRSDWGHLSSEGKQFIHLTAWA